MAPDRAAGSALVVALAAAQLGGCVERAPALARPVAGLTTPKGSLGHIEVRKLDARPRLTLVSRDGDPAPAVVVAVATDLDPVATTALAAILEARLQAAGFAVDARVDRSAFRLRLLAMDVRPGDPSAPPVPWAGDPQGRAAQPRALRFLGEVLAAYQRPITAGSPELLAASARLAALRRNPLDAAALEPVAACTGALGVLGASPAAEVTAGDAEGFRRLALHAGRTSIAAVGPSAFGLGVAAALQQTAEWPRGPEATDPWPAGEAAGVYVATVLEHRGARLSLAVRTADPQAAVAASARLGAPGSPLVARLRALPQPWRVVEVVGAARPRGGCVSVTLESATRAGALEPQAAAVAALVHGEMTAELADGGTAATATRQILGAADPREAASRAAWWALAGQAEGAEDRWALALGVAPSGPEPSEARFRDEVAGALAAVTLPVAERRVAVEQGQGELWVLLGSPCGAVEEGARDAGSAALAVLAAASAPRPDADVVLEPWITADGVGLVAHAPFRDERETAGELARRVGNAAARALTTTLLTPELAFSARAAALSHLERTEGRQGVAFEALAAALAPDHPGWIEPFGPWSGVAGGGPEGIRLRAQAMTAGPLRVAVLANGDAAQAAAAAAAVDRWLVPHAVARACLTTAALPPRFGHDDVRLPAEATLGQALLGAPAPPPGSAGRDLAELAAFALADAEGPLARALLPPASLASVRLVGGSRTAVLLVDVRAPADGLAAATRDARAALVRFGQTATQADLDRAVEAAAREAQRGRADPRGRLFELWLGRTAAAATRPTLEAFRAFCASALHEGGLAVVEARP